MKNPCVVSLASFIRISALALSVQAIPDGLHAAAYSIIELETFGGWFSQASSVNNTGQVVGFAMTSDYHDHAFSYVGGAMGDLSTLGGKHSGARAVNKHGRIVGGADIVGDFANRAFLFTGATMSDLGALGGTNSYAFDINDDDQVVGVADLTIAVGTNIPAVYHAFRWSGGTMTDLGTLGGTNSQANGINNDGQIVGWAQTTGNLARRAFLYSGGTMTDLGTLGGQNSEAYAVNDIGQIIGTAEITTNGWSASHPFLFSEGKMTDLTAQGFSLGFFDAKQNFVYGINNHGQIVGGATLSNGPLHACVWSNGTIADLNDLIDANAGWTLQIASAINDVGQIVGWGYRTPYLTHAFLLTPRPMLQDVHLAEGRAEFNLHGMTGFVHRVDYALSFPATNWIVLTNFVLGASPCRIVDTSALVSGQRFYRAVQAP